MIRIILYFLLAIASQGAMSCEKVVNPSRDCWNPPDEQVEDGLKRFYTIGEEIEDALFRNDKKEITRLTKEYLSLADTYKENWNYGNAIHDANVALGVVALREKSLKLAGDYLLKAGKSPGSPQLDSFGPDLSLANALLHAGENAVVAKYLRAVGSFWEGSQTKELPAVIELIEKGERPRLNQFQLLGGGS